jgi:Tfp pilus assembly protein FimT
MRRRPHRSRGYSLSELLTIVAIVGIISLIAIPAFMQLLPQYRIRSAASEIAASLRMLRSKSVGTRSNWRMVVNTADDTYRMLNGASAAVSDSGRPIPTGVPVDRKLASIDITAGGTIEFLRDGSASSAQTIVLRVYNNAVAFNQYTIAVETSGNVTITPAKV